MYRKRTELIQKMDHLIRLQATGDHIDFASKLNISKDVLDCLLAIMKEVYNAPVIYNQDRKCYEYTCKGRIQIGFK